LFDFGYYGYWCGVFVNWFFFVFEMLIKYVYFVLIVWGGGGGEYSGIKFHENPSSRSRVVPCRRTDMAKLIVALVLRASLLRVSNVI